MAHALLRYGLKSYFFSEGQKSVAKLVSQISLEEMATILGLAVHHNRIQAADASTIIDIENLANCIQSQRP